LKQLLARLTLANGASTGVRALPMYTEIPD
jgi:hypothetical protein